MTEEVAHLLGRFPAIFVRLGVALGGLVLGLVTRWLIFAGLRAYERRVLVEALRAELRRLLENHPLWDQRVCELQVTDSKESTLELRALVSAANAADLWALRCAVREQLVAHLQTPYPEGLPRTRAVLAVNNTLPR